MERKKVLVLFAHPAKEKSRVNKTLIESIYNQDDITIRELYEEYPDFHINVKFEQQLLLEHDIIVWHHPFYWYSAPAILKEWMDLVLEHNFAYGRKGTALAGKKVLSAITTGGSKEAYCDKGHNCFSIKQFLVPFKQSASLCKMEYLPPFIVHGTHLLTDNDIETFAQHYKRTLISLRDNLFDWNEVTHNEYLNDLIK